MIRCFLQHSITMLPLNKIINRLYVTKRNFPWCWLINSTGEGKYFIGGLLFFVEYFPIIYRYFCWWLRILTNWHHHDNIFLQRRNIFLFFSLQISSWCLSHGSVTSSLMDAFILKKVQVFLDIIHQVRKINQIIRKINIG